MQAAQIVDLHFHNIRRTSVTMLFQAAAPSAKSSRSPAIRHDGRRRFWTNISARTSTMADNARAKFENVLETDFAERTAKQEG